jgi:outer membrane protein OmpA-like peptidoglycan-associated protein
MRTKTLLFLFLFFSVLLISLSLWLITKPLYLQQVEAQRVANIQTLYRKTYLKKRDTHIPQRSIITAQKVINQLLIQYPILFEENLISLDNNQSSNRQTLSKIIAVINNMRENVILRIETHTDKSGSKKHNLKLSQQRADKIKLYIAQRTDIPFISAIGYGKEIPLKFKKKSYFRRIEFNLQRIQ